MYEAVHDPAQTEHRPARLTARIHKTTRNIKAAKLDGNAAQQIAPGTPCQNISGMRETSMLSKRFVLYCLVGNAHHFGGDDELSKQQHRW